jgi:tRNA(Ile)-lysidine synthase
MKKPGEHTTEYKTLADEVSAVIRRHSMLSGGETVMVGLSGGPDSVCLLALLGRIRDKLRLSIHAVYVNHNLRPEETGEEIEFCRDLCGRCGVPFVVKSIDVAAYAGQLRMNRQEAARELRYRAFEEAAFEVKADRIVLAHNADDQIETFLMRLLRGSGPKGLSGIPPTRGKIIRPLIETGRNEIEKFLDAEKIPFVVDSSNLEVHYLRNRLRKVLVPEMKKLNPNLASTLLNTTSILREEERFFGIAVTKALMKMISRKTDEKIELFIAPMEVMDTVILRRVLRRAIEETRGLRGIGYVHIEAIMGLIRNGASGDRLYLPKGIRVIRGYSLLIITSVPPSRIGEYELQPTAELALREAGLVIRASIEETAPDSGDGKSSVVLDADMVRFPLKVRARKSGDFFLPLGFGRRKKLQDFFVDEKVPRDERDSVPVLLSGDDIVWIAGHRADERFRITEKTRRFLKLSLLQGNF